MEFRRQFPKEGMTFEGQDVTKLIFAEDEAEYRDKLLENLRALRELHPGIDFTTHCEEKIVIINSYLQAEEMTELAGGCPIDEAAPASPYL